MRIGSKKIFHLEAWVIKVMSLYKVGFILVSNRDHSLILPVLAFLL